jgi:hypothetical protein
VEIAIFNRRKRLSDNQFPGATVLDLTSKGKLPWIRFSPFYPVGNIPVPGWPGLTSASVEGIWQGLKRFEHENHVDFSSFQNATMRNLKRTSRGRSDTGGPRGAVLGHQFGPDGSALLDYISARRMIYLPAYRWSLENRLQAEVEEIRALARSGPLVLLDYETNTDVEDTSRPLSHCSLVKRFVEGTWPEIESS